MKKSKKLLRYEDRARKHNTAHAQRVVNYIEQEPYDIHIQNNLNNMIHTYGRDRIEEVIQLMGLDKSKKRSAA